MRGDLASEDVQPGSGEGRKRWWWARRAVTMVTWGYGVIVLLVLMLQTWLGDLWWPTTMLLYGPRWVWALPLPILAMAAMGLRPVLLPCLAAMGLVVLVPVMGYQVRWGGEEPGLEGGRLVVLSLNTHGPGARIADLRRLIEREKPDLVALQEWSGDESEAFEGGMGWHVRRQRELVVGSRHPIRAAEVIDLRQTGHDAIVMRCEIELPGGPVAFGNIHLDTPRDGIDAVRYGGLGGVPRMKAKLAHRWEAAGEANRFLRETGLPLVIAGDFNLTTDSRIFREYWSDLFDAFAWSGRGFGWTRLTRWHGARIDHVLSSQPWRPKQCRVGMDVGSDHLPVVVVLSNEAFPR